MVQDMKKLLSFRYFLAMTYLSKILGTYSHVETDKSEEDPMSVIKIDPVKGHFDPRTFRPRTYRPGQFDLGRFDPWTF